MVLVGTRWEIFILYSIVRLRDHTINVIGGK